MSTKTMQRKAAVVCTEFAPVHTAVVELPVAVLPVEVLCAAPKKKLAPNAVVATVPTDCTWNTVRSSSQTMPTASAATVPVGQYCENNFCLVTGLVNEQPRNTPTQPVLAVPTGNPLVVASAPV